MKYGYIVKVLKRTKFSNFPNFRQQDVVATVGKFKKVVLFCFFLRKKINLPAAKNNLSLKKNSPVRQG